MASDLIIDRLDSDSWERVAELCKRRGIELPASYSGHDNDYLLISMLNLASIVLFINFAASLEGFEGPDAMNRTTFRNLPWWMESFWLPLDFDPPITDNGLFVGSSVRLLDELARIKEMSTIDLGALPPTYRDMRNDYTNWFNTPFDKRSEDDTLRWIWNALHEGAQISIEQKTPIWLAP